MVEFIFLGGDNDSVSRNDLIHGDVDGEKEADHEEADEDDRNNLPFFSHLSPFQRGVCISTTASNP